MINKIFYASLLASCTVFTSAMAQQIPLLTPSPSQSLSVATPRLNLAGEWSFEHQGKQDRIKVPGEWVMQGFDVNQGETAIYSRKFDVPNTWKGQRVKLRFDGVSSHAIVKVNGVKVATHEGSFVPFEADITNALKSGNNELIVEVQANTISDILACTSQYAVHTVGGILRQVTLFAVPEVNLADLTVTTTFDKSYQNSTLKLAVAVANQGKDNANAQLKYSLLDKNGKAVFSGNSDALQVAGGTVKRTTSSFAIKKPMQWNTEQPYLYTLVTEVLLDGKSVEQTRQKIGFREIAVKGNQLLVNGKPIKLRGVNRHSVHPLTGRSISDELELKDAKMFKEANCNYIRTSHYPASQKFIEAADSLGLFIEDESSLCWIQHHASPIWRLWDYKDEKFLPTMLAANLEKMQAAKNNPSVIIWSLGNESRWSPLWQKVLDQVKAFDSTRPTSFHDQCWGTFNNDGSKADVANYHYPGINGPAATDTMKRPTLFGEYAHVSTYNRLALATDPGMRSAYGLPLVKMYDSMYVHKGNLGGAIWSGIDDTFHLPNGNLVGYGAWGPIDGWRREKPEYWGMKKAYSPIVISNWDKPNVTGNVLTLNVENRYDFIALSQVDVKCEVDGKAIHLTSNIGAHQTGTIKIPVNKDTKKVYIAFYGPGSFLVNEELITLKATQPTPKAEKVALSVEENEMAYFIRQGDVSYTISKINGVIINAVKDKETILSQGPVFGFVAMNYDDGGKPNVAGETLQNNIHPDKNYPAYTIFAKNFKLEKNTDNITLAMDVNYTNGKGKMAYEFKADGAVKANYEAQTDGESPYQYGMIFQLPKSFENLVWYRKGEFSTYPKDHIGRLEGNAKLNAVTLPTTEQWGRPQAALWKDDANEMGSNDFRSTKTQIYKFSVSNAKGKGLQVLSDGKQAGRAWLQDEKINVLIADYSNNGTEPFYGSPFTDGRINTKGKTLKGSVTFKL